MPAQAWQPYEPYGRSRVATIVPEAKSLSSQGRGTKPYAIAAGHPRATRTTAMRDGRSFDGRNGGAQVCHARPGNEPRQRLDFLAGSTTYSMLRPEPSLEARHGFS
jgi:hypothetical protein